MGYMLPEQVPTLHSWLVTLVNVDKANLTKPSHTLKGANRTLQVKAKA